jgi:hypothetical protein
VGDDEGVIHTPYTTYKYHSRQFLVMEEKNTHNNVKQIISLLIIAMIVVSAFIGLNIFPTVQGMSSISPPAGSITPSATSNTTGKIVFNRFLPVPNCNEIRLLVRINGTASGYLKFPENNGTMNWTGGPESVTASYFDFQPGDGSINPGDYIELNGLSPSTLYSFALYHVLSYSLCSLAGPTNFGTPPNPPSDMTPSGTFPSLPTPEDIQEEKPLSLFPIVIISISIIGLISTVIYLGWKLTS